MRSSPQFGVTLFSYEMLQRFISPELEPKPPTNVPISSEDFESLRRSKAYEQFKRWEKVLPKDDK